jgi:hypothetical protein
MLEPLFLFPIMDHIISCVQYFTNVVLLPRKNGKFGLQVFSELEINVRLAENRLALAAGSHVANGAPRGGDRELMLTAVADEYRSFAGTIHVAGNRPAEWPQCAAICLPQPFP